MHVSFPTLASLLTLWSIVGSIDVPEVLPRAISACASIGTQISSASQVFYLGRALYKVSETTAREY